MTAVRVLGAAAAALLLAACGTSAAPAGRERATAPPLAPERVVVHVPKHHGSIGVVVLHSYDHSLSDLVAQGWNAAADRHGFIAIYPTRGSGWNAGLCCGAAVATDRDDVSWLDTQIHAAEVKYSLTAVYLAGDSNGGMMVERLVAERPTLTQRFAVWAAAPESSTVSAWHGVGSLFHGSRDAEIPLQGGTRRIGGMVTRINPAGYTARNLPRARLRFVTVAGFGHEPPPNWPEIAWHALQ